MPQVLINYWAVLVCALLYMALGMLWYSPLLFAKPWAKLMGFDLKNKEAMKKMQKEASSSYVVSLILGLVTAYVLAHFVQYLGATTFAAGMMVGFWLWVGFVAPVSLNQVLWAKKSFQLWLIDAGYDLVKFVFSAGILAVWIK